MVIRSGLPVRGFALLLALLLSAAPVGLADPVWPENTEAQRLLNSYVASVNELLVQQGEMPINSLFEAYASFEVFGITNLPDADVPESVEITVKLFASSINSLELRVSYLPRFPRIAAAFLAALNPASISLDQAIKEPTRRMEKALAAPQNSFQDSVEELNGTVPYVYYGYFPNQYDDGVSWIQMTIIFPMEGFWDGQSYQQGASATKGPLTYDDYDRSYEGYFSEDPYSHYETFTTPTPEPDSAAGNNPLSVPVDIATPEP